MNIMRMGMSFYEHLTEQWLNFHSHSISKVKDNPKYAREILISECLFKEAKSKTPIIEGLQKRTGVIEGLQRLYEIILTEEDDFSYVNNTLI